MSNELSVIGFDALYESMMKCRKGVLWKDSAAAYYLRGIERTLKLCRDLQSGKYKSSPPKHFMVTYPKPREIASVAFRDRIYQRSLNDNEVYPCMTNGFIYDNFACQKGKGTDAARERLKSFLHSHYRKYGVDGYVAQFDIKGYYPSMSHEIAEQTFKAALPEWAYERVVAILRNQYNGDRGYNPGSQLVQIAGISVLNPLDHYIKEQLHIKLYLRYMDDFILIYHDKGYLEECQNRITARLKNMGFDINKKKTRIFPLKNGIDFLGFTFRLTESGKVLMLIQSGNVKAQRRKLRRLVAKSKRGDIPRGKVDEAYAAWRNHASKGNSYGLLCRMDEYYRQLWEDDKDAYSTQKHGTT